jgi:hypothetical protein
LPVNKSQSLVGKRLSDYPEIAAQWHPTKNGDVTPDLVVAGSHAKYFWKCDKGPDHIWEAVVGSRTGGGVGCPCCAGRQVSETNSLAKLYPDIASQWHPTKNGGVMPDQVVAGSHKKYFWLCDKNPDHFWESSVTNRTTRGRSCPFCSGRQVSEANSLAKLFPEVAAQWHPTKNGDVTPNQVGVGSHKKYFWLCAQGPDHVWESSVEKRTFRGQGCPFCSGRQVSETNSLAKLYPEVAAQWHPTKNGEITPDQVVAGSNKKYFWLCDKGLDHVWEATVVNRTTKVSGCPSCSNRQASVDNSLAGLYPDIASQWHPTKNGDVTPNKVVATSHAKYFWKCEKGPDHVWEARVDSRTSQGNGCPVCSGRQVSEANSLAKLFPEVAAQWHPTKNGDVTPDLVTAGSSKKYFWLCSQGPDHVWEAAVASRTVLGTGCPRCNIGWTVSAIRGFVESLRSHLNSLTPAELYLLFQQNSLVDIGGKGKSFVKALATGRFPIDEIDRFIDGKPSLVDKFLDDGSQSLEILDQTFESVERHNNDNFIDRFSDGAELNEENLPILGAADVLSSLDSHVLISADEEAVEFLLASAVSKLWALAYRDEGAAVSQAKSFSGGDYALKARDRFLSEIQQARALPVPEDYRFQSNGKPAEPNLMQRHFAVRVLNNSRVGNWSGTGAGKTLAAIYASRLVSSRLTVICCPNSVVSGWTRSIQEIFPNSDVHSKTWHPRWAEHSTYRYLILNYEMFQQENSPPEVKALVETEQIDFLVVDEIHFTKQRSVENLSKRREMVTALASLASQRNQKLRVLGLSATPVINNLYEGRSLIDLVTGVENDDLEVSVPNVANCMRMHQRLVTLGIRWMPQYDIGYDQIEIPVDCGSFVEEIRALGKSGSPLGLEKILTLARLPVILNEVRRKTLIYTYYVHGIDRILRDALVAAGWSVGFYTGEDKSGLEAFIEGDLDILIGSSAISTGVDRLQHVCNRLIVNVLPWTAAEFEQLKGRIFRQGQASDRVTLVIPLTYAEVNGERWSWCESKMQRLKFKKSVADAVVDGVVPEGHLRSPTQAYRDLMTWLERLESGVLDTVVRKTVTISMEDLDDGETEKRVIRYGDFSEMNHRWNVSHSETTAKRLAGDVREWEQYHHLYREARKEWAVVPYEEFIRWAEKRSGYVIGDFGCGEALVAKSLAGAHTVHSFDHVAVDAEVVACDISNIPMDEESLDVVLFCLSLMGTNVSDYLREAYRVLKLDGHLHIWEPTSRFGDLGAFKASLKALGFDLLREGSEWKFTHLHLLKSAREPSLNTVVTFSSRR